ncbi:hypothetical protein FS749_005683 [Ceratobasidium sp. UAMH 11750]|nr:hypothetical protein FS749_005683 [Ceratobasidium sp. UAMH 11750]
MTSQRKLFLCVDCGGTKTAAVIADGTGTIVARGLGGPSNFTDVGMTAFLRAVKVAVEAALAEATGAQLLFQHLLYAPPFRRLVRNLGLRPPRRRDRTSTAPLNPPLTPHL